MEYGQAEVLSRPSNSRLADLYKTKDFVQGWENDVPFHIARNVLQLRRYRGLSQSKLAKELGSSQSAIARIESGQENITLDTLQRLIVALRARFHVSISPEEHSSRQTHPWWKLSGSTNPWIIVGSGSCQTSESDRLIIMAERPRQDYITHGGTFPNLLLEPTGV
jgi:transcriptional regulator with XRE-family HTH domain